MNRNPFHSSFSKRPILEAAFEEAAFQTVPIEVQRREAGYDFLERIGRSLVGKKDDADLVRLWREAVASEISRHHSLVYEGRLSARIRELERQIEEAGTADTASKLAEPVA